jgi:hypothetical protein
LSLFRNKIDAKFDTAARRLKTLVNGEGASSEDRRSSRNWSAIFEETVADDAPALELETR